MFVHFSTGGVAEIIIYNMNELFPYIYNLSDALVLGRAHTNLAQVFDGNVERYTCVSVHGIFICLVSKT